MSETYEVVTAFHCGDAKVEVGSIVSFDGNKTMIDGEVIKAANMRAGVKAGWLLPTGDTELKVEVEDPARSRYAGIVTTTEDDMVVGSATKRPNRTVVKADFVHGAEAQAQLEAQEADAVVVGSVTQEKLDENKKALQSRAQPATSGKSFRDTRTKADLEADMAEAIAKRNKSKVATPTERKKQAAEMDAKNTYPYEAHWRTRVSWLKENATKSMVRRVAKQSTPSFAKTLEKTFPDFL